MERVDEIQRLKSKYKQKEDDDKCQGMVFSHARGVWVAILSYTLCGAWVHRRWIV